MNNQIVIPQTLDGQGWKTRAVRATVRNGQPTSIMGCLVLAVLGYTRAPECPIRPRLGSTARIDKEGILYCNYQNMDDVIYPDIAIRPVTEIRDSFRGLADHLKLKDDERVAMFDELRKWIRHDERADQTPEERGLLQ